MFPLQNSGSVAVIKPASVASSATSTGVIDRMGYDEVKVVVLLDSAASTASNPVVLKLSESDDATTYTDITAFVGDATDGFTIPAVSATLPTVVELNVDARSRGRYLKLSVTPSTSGAMILGATAILGKAKDSTVARAEAAVSVTG
jgi:hypothetical protein